MKNNRWFRTRSREGFGSLPSLLLAMIVLAVIGCGGGGTGGTIGTGGRDIKGVILNQARVPQANVQVTIPASGQTDITDSQGQFEFEDVPDDLPIEFIFTIDDVSDQVSFDDYPDDADFIDLDFIYDEESDDFLIADSSFEECFDYECFDDESFDDPNQDFDSDPEFDPELDGVDDGADFVDEGIDDGGDFVDSGDDFVDDGSFDDQPEAEFNDPTFDPEDFEEASFNY